jgi:hypothetical protein
VPVWLPQAGDAQDRRKEARILARQESSACWHEAARPVWALRNTAGLIGPAAHRLSAAIKRIEMLHESIYWTGAVVWAGFASVAAYLAIEGLVAIGAAISWHRWAYLSAKQRSRNMPWLKLPMSLCKMWWDLLGHRRGNGREWSDSEGGEWKGIGRWRVGYGAAIKD